MPVTNKPEKQPQVINIEQASTPETYRAGMQLLLQELGSRERDKQLLLWSTEDAGFIRCLPASGLDLTVSEARALAAIQILLDRTGYKGHEQREINSDGFKGKIEVPILLESYPDIFEAYGLTKRGGQYHGVQREEAIKAFDNLASKKFPVLYKRRKSPGKCDIIKVFKPVIELDKLSFYKGLNKEQEEQVENGQEPLTANRAYGLRIELSPLFIEQIETFYTLLPAKLHREIQEAIGNIRYPNSINLFIKWLASKNEKVVKVDRETLFERLRLTSYVERRHRKEAEEQLEQAFQTAYAIKFLTEPASQDGTGVYTLHLNSERCSRVTAKVKRVEEAKKKAEQAAAKKAKRIEAAKEKAEQKKNSRH